MLPRTATTKARNRYNKGREPLQQSPGTATTKARNRYNKSPEPLQQYPPLGEPLQQHKNHSRRVFIHRTEPLQQRCSHHAHTMPPHFGDNLGSLAALLWAIQASAGPFWALRQAVAHRQAWCRASSAIENGKAPCGQAGALRKNGTITTMGHGDKSARPACAFVTMLRALFYSVFFLCSAHTRLT